MPEPTNSNYDSFKITKDFFIDANGNRRSKHFNISAQYSKKVNYLVLEPESDRSLNLLTVFVIDGDFGFIIITDQKCLIEQAAQYHINLNSHARFMGALFNIDPKSRLASVQLNFEFPMAVEA